MAVEETIESKVFRAENEMHDELCECEKIGRPPHADTTRWCDKCKHWCDLKQSEICDAYCPSHNPQ